MQQPGFNDMQLLQQTIMFKQLQELQKKQQLQQLGDTAQQNSINQFSATAKQAAGGQLPLLINGTPVRDSSSQVFMNLMQCSLSPAGQGIPNRMTFSQDQHQSMRSMGLVSQQPDMSSLNGTPVGNAGGIGSQYAQMQGMSRGLEKLLNKADSGNQTQKLTMQSTFGNPFPGDHDTFSSNVSMNQGAFAPKQGFPMKNDFGHASPQHGNILDTNTSLQDFNFRQEQVANFQTMQQKTTQYVPSQGLIPLDPLEQKILYNMDDDSWDTSFGKSMDMGATSFGSALEQTDNSSALQSGSWSALMQTAVAEASSCDTGVQEEWSGLTFQSTELSTDNQPSKFMDEERQPSGWADGNLQSASSNSKPFLMLSDPSISSSFPGFQQSGFQSLNQHGESLHQYDSHKSFQKSPRSAGEWSDYNPQQTSSNQISQQIQPLTHLEHTWAGQNDEHLESYMHGMAVHNTVSQKGDDVNLTMNKGRVFDGYQWTGQMEQLHYRLDNPKREESQVNRFAAAPNLGTGKPHPPDQKATCQFDYMKHVDFSPNNNENESGGETQHQPSSRNQIINTSYDGASDASDGQNVAPQTSQHMLELLHKVDRSRENSPMAHFSPTGRNSLSESPKVDAHDSYTAQMFDHSSVSQGFGLTLAPSQRSQNSSCFLPQDTPHGISNVNLIQVKNQGWLDSSSSVRPLPPNELSQRAYWDEISKSSGQANVFSNLNIQALASGLPHVGSQRQTQHINAPVSGEFSQATPTGRFPPFNSTSQDTSQQTSTNLFGQPFPAFESPSLSQPSSMSHMSPKRDMSARLQNTWKNVPASRLSYAAPSVDPSKNSMETTSLASQEGDCDINSLGSDYGQQPGTHRFKQEMPSEKNDTSQSGGLSEGQKSVAKHILSESNQQDPDRVLHGDNHALAASERNIESFNRSLEASQTAHQNYTLLRQMQAMKSSSETNPSKAAIRRYNEADIVTNVQQINDIAGQHSIYEPNSRFLGPDLSRINASTPGDQKMPSFLTDTREELGGESFSQPNIQSLQGIGTFNQNGSQNQTKGVMYSHTENSQVNSHMAPMWSKQYGTSRSGHMQPMYDVGLAKTTMELFTPGSYAAVDQRGAAFPGQVGSISPSPTGTLVASENFSALHVLPSDLVEQVRPSVGAKKRKSIGSERLPWHKEVAQGSQRLPDISTAEQEWACATNRLTEKIGEEQPVYQRSKRRLILTTQLTQQLLRPAPASILSGDASSQCDSVIYLVARLALGDACSSLTYDSTKGLNAAPGNSNLISEKPKAFESDKHFTKVEEDFTDRAKKLENDFLRLESASISDISIDCQDLERYSVINRFAKFHMRGQSGTSSSSTMMSPLKSLPQKWVNVLPMPRNPPEDAQCFSL